MVGMCVEGEVPVLLGTTEELGGKKREKERVVYKREGVSII